MQTKSSKRRFIDLNVGDVFYHVGMMGDVRSLMVASLSLWKSGKGKSYFIREEDASSGTSVLVGPFRSDDDYIFADEGEALLCSKQACQPVFDVGDDLYYVDMCGNIVEHIVTKVIVWKRNDGFTYLTEVSEKETDTGKQSAKRKRTTSEPAACGEFRSDCGFIFESWENAQVFAKTLMSE